MNWSQAVWEGVAGLYTTALKKQDPGKEQGLWFFRTEGVDSTILILKK